ncbi:hypothetical protein [Kitasatospora sp. NPDC059160]|uniref:hypothetical protein n=1 Tax=Kitasatospora sp. NPDC059160 TaxID=3346748 RepID=UPI0036AC83B7
MTITPTPVASYPIPSGSNSRSSVDPTGPVPRLEVHDGTSLRLYDLREQAELKAEFPAPGPEWWAPVWTAPDLSFAVFGTGDGYVATAQDGTELWRQPYGTWRVDRWGYVLFTVTGPDRELRIWLRLPSGLPDATLFLTLDAEGRVLARSVLECGGYERYARLLLDADGEVIGVDVSGGSGPTTRHRLRRESGALVLAEPLPQDAVPRLPADRDYLDADSGNTRCMTVDRRGRDISWHAVPSYEVTATLRLSDFPAPGTGDCSVHNDPSISSLSGFVDDSTVLVTLHNRYDEGAVLLFGEQDWREYSHWLADPATGALHGRLEYPMSEVDYVLPLGDGTWLTQEWNAYRRWRR